MANLASPAPRLTELHHGPDKEPDLTPPHTHLVKHPVSELQELAEEVQPAVQEGEEAQQQEHDT